MTKHNAGAAATAVAPIMLAGALLWHPPIPGRLPDSAAVAGHIAENPVVWGLAHIALAVASAFLIVAFAAIHGFLRDAGDRWLSAAGFSLIVLGSLGYALLPGMEFGPLAAHEAGADAGAVQDALMTWFTPVLLISGVAFVLGAAGFAAAIKRTGALGRTEGTIAALALMVFAASRIIPIGIVQFYAQPLAAAVALWLIASAMWASTATRQHRTSTRPPEEARL
ncbi:hypothetical protein [Lolliginicoccus suaedae]|uniref:hypothetical protein n=1 Tax=Lolliginicoccus suaedae TaxID=2605429 RepID=UPI0011EEFD2A|nr:hypothetical protein [Lolliginicoccus suaedae]